MPVVATIVKVNDDGTPDPDPPEKEKINVIPLDAPFAIKLVPEKAIFAAMYTPGLVDKPLIKELAVPGSPYTKYLFKQLLYVGVVDEFIVIVVPLVISTLLKSENPFGHEPPGIPTINPTSPLVPPLLGKTSGLL